MLLRKDMLSNPQSKLVESACFVGRNLRIPAIPLNHCKLVGTWKESFEICRNVENSIASVMRRVLEVEDPVAASVLQQSILLEQMRHLEGLGKLKYCFVRTVQTNSQICKKLVDEFVLQSMQMGQFLALR